MYIIKITYYFENIHKGKKILFPKLTSQGQSLKHQCDWNWFSLVVMSGRFKLFNKKHCLQKSCVERNNKWR